jgi:hypothetical protein
MLLPYMVTKVTVTRFSVSWRVLVIEENLLSPTTQAYHAFSTFQTIQSGEGKMKVSKKYLYLKRPNLS